MTLTPTAENSSRKTIYINPIFIDIGTDIGIEMSLKIVVKTLNHKDI